MFTLIQWFNNSIKTAVAMGIDLIEDQRKVQALQQHLSESENSIDCINVCDAFNDTQKKHSIALMRINYTGEICAQALYSAQLRFAKQTNTKKFLQQAKQEEQQHLIWCKKRLNELGGKTSYLDPFWYIGSYLIGAGAAYYSDSVSLGFVYHTEAQVEQHLHKHIVQLNYDPKSVYILQKMVLDEANHGVTALALGGTILPKSVQLLMKTTSKVMTTASYYV